MRTLRRLGAILVTLLWIGGFGPSHVPSSIGIAAAAPAPTPTLTKTLDISVYSGSITSAQVANWKANGWSHVIVGTQNASTANEQLTQCVAGGMTVDVYVYLHFGSSMTTQVNNALTIASGHPVGRLWLDCEDTATTYSKSTYISKISEAVSAAGSMPVGIYTGGWWWTPRIGSSHPFTSLPLWYANYDGVASLSTWSSQAFGGWSSPTGKQYKGDVYTDGVDTDLSVLLLDSGGTPPPPPPPPPSSSNTAQQCTASTLNVRSGPGTSYSIIGTISSGQQYVAIASSGGWYQIYYKNNTGWCYGGYLTTVTGVTGVQVSVSSLNVRTGPGTGYSIIGTVSSPQTYIRTATSSGWNQYYYGGGTGWSSGTYMTTTSF